MVVEEVRGVKKGAQGATQWEGVRSGWRGWGEDKERAGPYRLDGRKKGGQETLTQRVARHGRG